MRKPEPDLLARAPAPYAHATAGLGTPEGLVGVGVGVTPTDWSSVEVGAGMAGFGNDSEPQVAVMASLRAQVTSITTLGIGSGVSLGAAFHWNDGSLFQEPGSYKTWHWPLWLNTELQVRHALSDSSAMRFHVGLAKSIATGPTDCGANRYCREVEITAFVPYVGIGVEQDF
jgi:hypothetical protein